MCLYTGTPKSINFPFGTNGKLMVFGVPIPVLEPFKVLDICKSCKINLGQVVQN